VELDLNAGANKAEILEAIEGHSLGLAEYRGVFGR